MTLNINIPAELDGRLRRAADDRGVEPAELARQLIEEHVPQPDAGRNTLPLFGGWEATSRGTSPGRFRD